MNECCEKMKQMKKKMRKRNEKKSEKTKRTKWNSFHRLIFKFFIDRAFDKLITLKKYNDKCNKFINSIEQKQWRNEWKENQFNVMFKFFIIR